jgi:sister-chromatid-cohesion protein PDS5
MTNLYYGTIKQLLERISSVMIDREAIQHLVGLVKEVSYLFSSMLKNLLFV